MEQAEYLSRELCDQEILWRYWIIVVYNNQKWKFRPKAGNMSPNNVYHEEKFVGRQNELAQFEQAIKSQNKLKVFLKLGIEVQPRVFLPYGIGGMGKTWLSRECLRRAKKGGWKIIEINWEKVDLLPVDETEMMDTISQFIKKEYGEKIARNYLKSRQDSKQVAEKVSRLKQENQEKWLSIVD